MEVHLEALKGIQEALRQAEEHRRAADQQRSRAELSERQKMALEMELQKYQVALTEQSESLAEARAAVLIIDAQNSQLKVSMPKPSFGQRLRTWLNGSIASVRSWPSMVNRLERKSIS